MAGKILYPDLRVNGVLIPPGSCRITFSQAKTYLGWEEEEEYKSRTGHAFTDKMFVLELDSGQRVTCHNSTRNRPFYERHARRLAQDILNKNWAGPSAMPFLTTPNCETIIIGKSGQVLSANHRLIGLGIAYGLWQAKDKYLEHQWRLNWPTGPVIDSLVVTGCDEHPKLIRTLDNVKPRTPADMFYTSPLFERLDTKQRKECARMLDLATSLLWHRTGADDRMANPLHQYRTNSEAASFVESHPKLLDCVAHLFQCNRDRVLSLLRLSPGECSAALYLMGCCDSDGDQYRNADPPCEQLLEWGRWESAKQFWSLLSQKNPKLHPAVKAAVAMLSGGEESSSAIKLAILAKAWIAFLANSRVDECDLSLEYQQDRDDFSHMVERPIFGNLDLGAKPAKFPKLAPAEKQS